MPKRIFTKIFTENIFSPLIIHQLFHFKIHRRKLFKNRFGKNFPCLVVRERRFFLFKKMSLRLFMDVGIKDAEILSGSNKEFWSLIPLTSSPDFHIRKDGNKLSKHQLNFLSKTSRTFFAKPSIVNGFCI
jgi:hypothetical protein